MASISVDEVLSSANQLLLETGVIKTRLVSVRQCNSSIFAALYNVLTGEDIPAKKRGVWSTSSMNEAVRCQCVIDSLSELLPPEISLSHISGCDIAKCDLLGVKNLLDIFGILLSSVTIATPADEDSNLLTEEGMQVINEVLEEELDSTPQNTSSLLRGVSTTDSDEVPITVPTSVAPPIFSTKDFHDGVDVTTPLKHTCQLTTPLHSTPRQGMRMKLGNNKGQHVNTPPLSISTLSSESTTVNHRTTSDRSDALAGSLESLPLEVGVSNRQEEVTEEAVKSKESHKSSQGVQKGEGTSNSGNTRIPRNELINKIVANYVSNRNSYVPRTKKRPTTNKIKGKHHPTDVTSTVNRSHNVQGFTTHPPAGAECKLVLEAVERALPGVRLSPSTVRRYWTREMSVMKARMSCPPIANPVVKKANEIERRHNTLVQVVKKDLQHSHRMQTLLEEKIQRNALQSLVRNQRLTNVRARKYFKDFEITIRNKLQRKRTKEERVFRCAYEECLKLMKDKVREMKSYAKEKQLLEARKYEIELESMEKFYRDKLEMLAEAIKENEENTRIRDKAHKQDVKKVGRELRLALESDVSELWAGLENWESDCVHFRELDKEQLKNKLLKC